MRCGVKSCRVAHVVQCSMDCHDCARIDAIGTSISRACSFRSMHVRAKRVQSIVVLCTTPEMDPRWLQVGPQEAPRDLKKRYSDRECNLNIFSVSESERQDPQNMLGGLLRGTQGAAPCPSKDPRWLQVGPQEAPRDLKKDIPIGSAI